MSRVGGQQLRYSHGASESLPSSINTVLPKLCTVSTEVADTIFDVLCSCRLHPSFSRRGHGILPFLGTRSIAVASGDTAELPMQASNAPKRYIKDRLLSHFPRDICLDRDQGYRIGRHEGSLPFIAKLGHIIVIR